MNIVISILIVLAGILIIIGSIVNFKNKENNYQIFSFGMGIMVSMLIIGIPYSLSIPAIDVYRGKTTLEITYKDNIPIDSVVVYKNK
jgi:TRAP-type C4-dicarboxylate transport system permease small subunit